MDWMFFIQLVAIMIIASFIGELYRHYNYRKQDFDLKHIIVNIASTLLLTFILIIILREFLFLSDRLLFVLAALLAYNGTVIIKSIKMYMIRLLRER